MGLRRFELATYREDPKAYPVFPIQNIDRFAPYLKVMMQGKEPYDSIFLVNFLLKYVSD